MSILSEKTMIELEAAAGAYSGRRFFEEELKEDPNFDNIPLQENNFIAGAIWMDSHLFMQIDPRIGK